MTSITSVADGAPIRRARDEDLPIIHDWLVDQPVEVESMLANWRLALKSHHEDNDLWVYVDPVDNAPVAYFWGNLNTAASVMDVRFNYRRKGIGRQIVHYLEALSRRNQDSLLEIQCAPESSADFWQQMGFKTFWNGDQLYGRKKLKIEYPAPPKAAIAAVTISFFPDSIMWNSDTPAIVEYNLTGWRVDDGSIQLPEQIGHYQDDGRNDLVGRIVVDGKCAFQDKIKRACAETVGFVHCQAGWTIDRIRLAT